MPSAKPLMCRVAFLASQNPADPDAISGMPHRMYQALQDLVPSIVPLYARRRIMYDATARQQRAPLADRLYLRALSTWHHFIEAVGKRIHSLDYWHTKRHGRRIAADLSAQLRLQQVDVVFACLGANWIPFLDTDLPVVYYSDATAALVRAYPVMSRRSTGYRRARFEQERLTMQRVRRAAFASEASLRSAIQDFGLPPERGCVVPMGATVTPDTPLPRDFTPECPSRENLRLCMIAGDPVRKRLHIAVEATRRLRQAGWNVRLIHVGTPSPDAVGLDYVESVGRLRLSDAQDRHRHQQILASSHLLLLPSLTEGAAISPAEAAHFGRPSIVSAAGGLPTVVKHNVTGLVLPVDAGAQPYADASVSLASDPDRYRRMAWAALHRAKSTLSWDAWGLAIRSIILDALADVRQEPRVFLAALAGDAG